MPPNNFFSCLFFAYVIMLGVVSRWGQGVVESLPHLTPDEGGAILFKYDAIATGLFVLAVVIWIASWLAIDTIKDSFRERAMRVALARVTKHFAEPLDGYAVALSRGAFMIMNPATGRAFTEVSAEDVQQLKPVLGERRKLPISNSPRSQL